MALPSESLGGKGLRDILPSESWEAMEDGLKFCMDVYGVANMTMIVE